MSLSRLLIPFAISILACGLSAAQTPTEPSKQESVTNQTASPKLIYSPPPMYPEEARRKGIEGKVTLSIVIDANGNVSQAKALRGPKELELVPAAIDYVRKWQYERPASAPVTKTVEVGYGFPKECPGPLSDIGQVEGTGRLYDKNGKLVAVVDNDDYPSPRYPEQERRSGVAGKMILSVSLSSDGHVKEIHVVKSLSPGLDESVIDMVRRWRFKGCQGEPLCADANSNFPFEDLRLDFIFSALCHPVL